MAGNKYLKLGSSGFPQEQASLQTSSGAGDAGSIVALNSSGLIDDTMLSIQAASQSMTAGESLSAGDFVYINTADSNKIYKADADAVAKKAIGYVKSAATTGNPVTVYFEGINSNLTSLTVGSDYFLSATAGGVTTTPPSSSAQIVQYLGTAVTTTAIPFKFSPPIVVA